MADNSQNLPRAEALSNSSRSARAKFPLGGDSAKDQTGSPYLLESTYAVAHVVPARSHRLRAAATLNASGAAAPGTQAGTGGSLRRCPNADPRGQAPRR